MNTNSDYKRIIELASEYKWTVTFKYDGQTGTNTFLCVNDHGTEIYNYQTESSRYEDAFDASDYNRILSQLLRKVY